MKIGEIVVLSAGLSFFPNSLHGQKHGQVGKGTFAPLLKDCLQCFDAVGWVAGRASDL